MLFDLRSPRRRRVVQIVFGGLALLFAVSFIGFGIGSGGLNGGLFDALGLTDSSGRAGGGFATEVNDAEAKVEAQQRNEQAWADLTVLYLQAGNSQLDIDQSTGQPSVTSDAEEDFNKAADAWDRYLKLNPKNPDSAVALQMAGAFFL